MAARRSVRIVALAIACACSPTPPETEARIDGPSVVLDEQTTTRSFLVRPCVFDRLDDLYATFDARARATQRGDHDPWVRMVVEPVPIVEADDGFDGHDAEDVYDDARLPSTRPVDLRLIVEADAPKNVVDLCLDGFAVVTFELPEPSAGARVEIEWEIHVRSPGTATIELELDG